MKENTKESEQGEEKADLLDIDSKRPFASRLHSPPEFCLDLFYSRHHPRHSWKLRKNLSLTVDQNIQELSHVLPVSAVVRSEQMNGKREESYLVESFQTIDGLDL